MRGRAVGGPSGRPPAAPASACCINRSVRPRAHAQVHTVVSTNCLSAGEALRVLDQKDLVKGDFVLVTGARGFSLVERAWGACAGGGDLGGWVARLDG